MKKYLVFFVIIALTLSCKKASVSEVETIDFESSNRASISSLFQDIHIIPLETASDGLIGLDIQRMEIFDNKIFILNNLSSHNNILCFDKNTGSFLFKIDRMGQGPGEYIYLGDILIDKYKKQLVLASEAGRYLFFDLNGFILCGPIIFI
jgi:hypothetical protein